MTKVIRSELRKREIRKVKVLYSKEKPIAVSRSEETKGTSNRPVPGSIAIVPAAAGLMIAGEVVKDLLEEK